MEKFVYETVATQASIAVPHNLDTVDVVVQVYNADGLLVAAIWQSQDANTLVVNKSNNSSEFQAGTRVVVIG